MVFCFLLIRSIQLRIVSLPLFRVFFLCLFCSCLFKNFEKRQPVEGLHDKLSSLFSFILVKGFLAYDVWMIRQIQSFHYLIFKASFVEVIRNSATYLFYGEKFIICDPLAFFHGPISAFSEEFICSCHKKMVAQLRVFIICLYYYFTILTIE